MSLAASQDVTVECQFSLNFYNDYICDLSQIEVLNETAQVTFTGDHIDGRTNGNVSIVHIRASNTPFMVQSVFTSFANLTELEYDNSNLQSINLPGGVRLDNLVLTNNNISRIQANAFVNQPRLRYVRLSNNNIQEVDETAFVGLSEVIALWLLNNQIRVIQPRTFQPLASVTYLDLEGNDLTSVGDLFTSNDNLVSLFLEYNRINEISPNFVRRSTPLLRNINLRGNRCANDWFTLQPNDGWQAMTHALRPCFMNFVGPQDPIVLECEFYVDVYGDYSCRLSGIEVTNQFVNVTFTGEHMGNRSDSDVRVVEIVDSNTPFIINELATAFPNAYEWYISSSNV